MSSKIIDASFENIDLRQRIFWSFALIALIEFGNLIPIPGVDYYLLAKVGQPGSNADFTQYFTTFIDIDLIDIGFFSLGVYPYINASIFFQVLLVVLPNWKKLQKEEGEIGRRILKQYLRYITLFFATLQSLGLILLLKPYILDWNIFTILNLVLTLTTGSMIVLWLSELITRFSLTNGSSLVIVFSIIGQLPAFAQSIIKVAIEERSILKIFLVIVIFLFVLSCVIFVQESVRTVPLLVVRQETQKVFMPFRLNQSGVMPLICSSAMMSNFKNLTNNFNLLNTDVILKSRLFSNFLTYFNGLSYSFIYFILILSFTYLYSSIFIDPVDVSEDLKKLTANVPNIRPGISTSSFLEGVVKRTNFFGGIILGLTVLIVNSVDYFIQIPGLKNVGVSSQLIIITVILEVLKKSELLLIARKLKNESEKIDYES